MYIETKIIERNYCEFNFRTRNYRTELVNVRNVGENNYIYCPAFMIVEKVVLYICIFGHHGYSTNIHYWSELGTLRTS